MRHSLSRVCIQYSSLLLEFTGGHCSYYEWLTKGKDQVASLTKRKDNRLLLLAGLYDSVVLDGEYNLSILYSMGSPTVATRLGKNALDIHNSPLTDANKEFSWLHDRQPVFLFQPRRSYAVARHVLPDVDLPS